MREFEALIAGRSVMIRDTGDLPGPAVLYFHGTPGSRLDVAFGDHVATKLGVRVVSFDRPGYGRSEPSPFGLTGIAKLGEAIADLLGIERVAAFGWSGGGPFALAAAAVMGNRVSRVGVASGPAPFQQMPGALDMLGDGDREALSLLPDEPARAAEAFCAGSEGITAAIDDEESFMAGVDALFGATDADVLGDPRLRHHLFAMLSEGMRQGFTGVGWDNVAWVGPWDIDVSMVRCPVHLWYGGQDSMMPVEHGRWLADNLADADLVVYDGEGHLGPMRHWSEMLTAITSESGPTRPAW
ncbi:MAG: alpha/beta hydrolase [Microthrixaceae bacterium]